ncbi:MAG: hypothetical protein KDD51_06685 [Bdellovibrionales bacterium]|nr:hypothetical protein [Bdellovibrionales bacterium]
MKTLRLKRLFRRSLFAAAFILLQLNVGCTGQRANSLVQTGGVSLPDLTGTPFGDNYQLDNPFGTGDDFTADDFVFTDTSSTSTLDDTVFNLDGSGATVQNDCTNSDLFASGNVGSNTNYLNNCLDTTQLASLGQDYGDAAGVSPLQLLLSQMTQGTMYGLQCIHVAYLYQPIVQQDPELGFVLAMAGITDCYRQIFNQVAGSPYYAYATQYRMQSFEPQWIAMIQDALNQ